MKTLRKFLRLLLNLVTILFVLGVVAVGALLFVVDPDRYRMPLEQLVEDATGLDLTLAGNLSLFLRPRIGIRLEDVRLTNPGKPQELASVPTVEIGVDPWKLLKGQLVIYELRAEDLHLNWFTDDDGNHLWSTEALTRLNELHLVNTESAIQVPIRLVTLDSASIDVQNLRQRLHYSLDNLELVARGSNSANNAFRVHAEFDLSDERSNQPRHLSVSSLNQLNLPGGDLDVGELQITYTPVLLQGDLSVRDLFGSTSWNGKLVSNRFHLRELLDNLGASQAEQSTLTAPALVESLPDEATLQVTFNGDHQQMRIPSLAVTLGEMQMHSDAVIRFSDGLTPTNMSFKVETNELDLSPYMAEQDASVAVTEIGAEPATGIGIAVTPAPTPPFSLSTDWLNSVNVQGNITIASIRYRDIQTGYLNLFANLEDGVLDLESQPVDFEDGSLQGTLRVDGRSAPANWSMGLQGSNIDMADLTLPLIQDDALIGRLTLESSVSGRGNTLPALRDSLTGYGSFKVDSSLVDIGVVKQVFTAIMTLAPTAEAIQQWPDAIGFSQLGGYVVFNRGLASNQDVHLRLDNIDIAGTGGLDLDAGNFNYQLMFSILGDPFNPAVLINERYRNSEWPVICNAAFDADISQYCRPEFPRVREQFVRLGETAPPALDNLLNRPLPDALPDTARSMLPTVVLP